MGCGAISPMTQKEDTPPAPLPRRSLSQSQEEMKVALDYPPQLKAVKKAVVVQPVEMAKKLMDIREQLALEWKEDLDNIGVTAVRASDAAGLEKQNVPNIFPNFLPALV